jgi:hypothetical protein
LEGGLALVGNTFTLEALGLCLSFCLLDGKKLLSLSLCIGTPLSGCLARGRHKRGDVGESQLDSSQETEE